MTRLRLRRARLSWPTFLPLERSSVHEALPPREPQHARLQQRRPASRTGLTEGAAPVTRLRIWCRMLLNLIVYGRPTPPPYVFREPSE